MTLKSMPMILIKSMIKKYFNKKLKISEISVLGYFYIVSLHYSNETLKNSKILINLKLLNFLETIKRTID